MNHAQYSYTFSDSVNFTVQAAPVTHTHNYQRVTVKATTTANGYTQEQCSCGSIQNKQIIYYPKKIQLSRTSYTYDGKVKTPKVKVTGANKKTISSGNYKVTYSRGRKNVGTYKVTVKFKGNYSGTTCDGAYGSHGARGQAWYRMNQYQNKKLQTQTTTSESDWTTGKDSTAVKTVYRYKAK